MLYNRLSAAAAGLGARLLVVTAAADDRRRGETGASEGSAAKEPPAGQTALLQSGPKAIIFHSFSFRVFQPIMLCHYLNLRKALSIGFVYRIHVWRRHHLAVLVCHVD